MRAWLASGRAGRGAEWLLLGAAAVVRLRQRLLPRGHGLALVYHRVAPDGGDPASELVPALGVALLECQLRYLVRHYAAVPAGELVAAATTRRRGGRIPVAITFDDDYSCHLDLVAPVLRRVGVPATFFLCGTSLDVPRSFWWERLQRAADAGRLDAPIRAEAARIESLCPDERAAVDAQLGAVSPDPEDAGLRRAQVAALAREFEIGFHTREHDALDTVSDENLARVLRHGRAELEAVTGAPLEVIAYPHGRFDARTSASVDAAGFRAGFTMEDRPLRAGGDPRLIGRVEPRWPSLGAFSLQLARR